MSEPKREEYPDTDARNYKPGDFVQFQLHSTSPLFAAVTGVHGDEIIIRHFEDGMPWEISKYPKTGSIRKATVSEAVDHFYKISERFENEIGAGGLAGAISARKQHYIDGILAQLNKNREYPHFAVTNPPNDPMTGVYVLMGIYSGQGPSEHMEGLIVAPRLSEDTISRVMIDAYKDGFGRIPSDVYNTRATSHGSLVAFWTYEVPEKALALVVNPKELELRLR